MIRYKCLPVLLLLSVPVFAQSGGEVRSGADERAIWVETLTRIADPVLHHLSHQTLKAEMPYESLGDGRKAFSYLEAVGRLMCGIAPWLELGPDNTPEGQLRAKYIALAVSGLRHAVDPASPDYLEFEKPYQPLVDAAFLAQGLLRAPTQLWGNLGDEGQRRMVEALKLSRKIKPWENNWLLFASIVEAALLEFTGECDRERLLYGVRRFRDEWYKGDGWYGDGPAFHLDYYNSFVIHPMLTDILAVMERCGETTDGFSALQRKRHARYAVQQERMISPEGTYPVVGRSIVYRVGVFHALAHAAFAGMLPESLAPAQVRCALTAVILRQMTPAGTFDDNGWLKIGFAGEQIRMSESYINTGSLYLCASGWLPLGLPPTHPFWSGEFTPWTALRAWSGTDVGRDSAIRD